MTTPLYDLSNLTQSKVDAVRALLRQAIENYTGEYDLNRGVIHDVVLELSALLTTATENDVDSVRSDASLADIISDPSAASTEIVDSVASNYRVYRKTGAKASGSVAIVLSSSSSVTVKKGTKVTISGVTFLVTNTITSKPVGTVIPTVQLPYARVVTNVGDRYVFTVDVEAESNGTGGNIPSNVPATLATVPPRFVQAYTQGSLTGGLDDESNQAMVDRLLAGASIKSWGSRTSLDGMLREQYPTIVDTSIIGASDDEMLRDKHGLVPISTGGKTDAYIKSAALYETKVVTMNALLIAKVGSYGNWRIQVGRDIAPGFYDVQKILLTTKLLTESGFTPTSDVRNYDLSGDIYAPDITSSLEAVYSRYQTAEITFYDNLTVTTGNSFVANSTTKQYQVVFRCMPDLDTIQEWLGDDDQRSLSSDILVKAPVPVYVSMSLNLIIPKKTSTPNVNTVKTAITNAVNSQGFSDILTTSVISNAVKSVSTTAIVDSLSMTGSLKKPSLTTTTLTGSTLTITADTANMVSSKTATFFTSNDQITITIVNQ